MSFVLIEKKPKANHLRASTQLTSTVVLEVRTAVSDIETSMVAVTGLVVGVFNDSVDRRLLDDAVGVFAVAALPG